MGTLGIAFLTADRLGPSDPSAQANFRTTLHTAARLLMLPISAVVEFFAPWQATSAAKRSAGATQTVASNYGTAAANNQWYSQAQAPQQQRTSRVRVLRVVEAGCSAHNAGRMMISGRFSEVCAELDRLSLQETQQEAA